MLTENIKDSVLKAFTKAFAWQPDGLALLSPDPEFGDFAVVCHPFAKELKLSPQAIASALAEAISAPLIIKAQAAAGYLNLTVDAGALAKDVLARVVAGEKDFGKDKDIKKKVVIEYSQPNTNKPMHLGHVRNNVLGMALGNILDSRGRDVFLADIVNDRGIHITKSMVAYQNWGQGETPEQAGQKGDHYVGKFYVRFEKEFEKEWQEFLKGNPEVPGLAAEDRAKRRQEFFGRSEVGQAAQALLRKWEAGDEDTLALWRQMNQWVYEGFAITYQKLGSKFDKRWYESETYLLGKKIVEKGVKDGVFIREDDGSVWVDLEAVGLDRKLLLRGDGTSVYITQDLGLAVERQKELGFASMIYVVGHEQEYHFQVLFATLKKLGYEWADKLYHLSYGLVFLPEGKMKSREGRVVDADDIMAEVEALAFKEIKKRDIEIPDEAAFERARVIGLGALKFFLLRVTPSQAIHYDPKEAIAFEGATGPYVQYVHARIASIFGEETPLPASEIDFNLLKEPEEKHLSCLLLKYPETVKQAADEFNPSLVCNYLLDLARAFSGFYHKHHVLKAETEELKHSRLFLLKAVQIVIANGLGLLGIAAPEKM